VLDAVTATSYYYADWPPLPLIAVEGLHGRHDFADLWDGTSALEDFEPDQSMQVPDATGDGTSDYWFLDVLVPGPLLGKVTSRTSAVATLTGSEHAYAGGFDADGDGNHDLLTLYGQDQAIIHYGPLPLGDVPSPRTEKVARDQYSTLGSGTENLEPAATVLSDHYRGRDGVVIGKEGLAADSLAFVLDVPRGTHVPTAQAQARVKVSALGDRVVWGDVGDVNGDGQPDVIYGTTFLPLLGAGPVAGNLYYGDGAEDLPPALRHDEVLEDPRFGVGDLNGDGVQELVATVAIGWDPSNPYDSGERWTVLLFSPHSDPLNMACALPIGGVDSPATDGSDFGEHAVDLDGDGLNDIVNVSHHETQINIWWGADLLSAYNELNPCP